MENKCQHSQENMTDPWVVRDGENSAVSDLTDSSSSNTDRNGFEDNFASNPNQAQSKSAQNLPDSREYLQSLERKLNRLKRDPNLLRQLAAKRQECINNLLNDNVFVSHDDDLVLDAPIASGESAVYEIYRHLRPVQPLNVGEIVNIVDHDQLEEKRVQDETSSETSETASR